MGLARLRSEPVDDRQLGPLRQLGADRAQGSLIARAAPVVPGIPAIRRHWIGDLAARR